MSEHTYTSPMGVEQVDPHSVEAPERRIADAGQAHAVAEKLFQNDEERDKRRRDVAKLVNRHRPYSQAALEALGQGHRSNVNFGTAEAVCEDVFATYWDIVTNVPNLVNVTVRGRGNASARREWGQIISAELHDVLDDEWAEFYFELSMFLTQLIRFGVGPVAFPDETDWKFRSWKAGGLLLPNKTRPVPSEWRLVATPGHLTVDELWDHYNNESAADAGWSKHAIQQSLFRVFYKGAGEYDAGKWESAHQKLRNGDLHESVQVGDVEVWHVYVKEVEGGVSHYIVPKEGVSSVTTEDGERPPLFFRPNRFDDFPEFLHVFFRNYGDGYVHSVRGVGDKIFAHGQLDNRILNNIADALMWSSSIVLKSQGLDGADEEIPLIKVGPVTVLPRQFDVIDSLAGTQLQSQIGGLHVLQRQLVANTKIHRQDALDTSGRRAKSATQSAIDAQDQAQLQKSEVTFFQKQLDRLYREMVRRLLGSRDAIAQKFRERVLAQGVPEEVLDFEQLRIRAGRAIGYGSASQRRQIVQYLDAHLAMFDEFGQKEALRLGLSSVGGQELVDLFMPRVGEDREPTTDATLVSLEEAHLRRGDQLEVGADQLHLYHIGKHLPSLAESAQAAGVEGADIVAALQHLTAGIPHTEMHIRYAQRNPATKGRADAAYQQLSRLAKIRTQLEQQVADQQQAQQDAAQAEQQRQIQIEAAKLQQEFTLKKHRIDGELLLKRFQADQEHQINMMREANKADAASREHQARVQAQATGNQE